MVEIDMAILIPSKNIYEKKNPKVRDNAIDRIEVGAVEVKPNNEYGVVVKTTNDDEGTRTGEAVQAFKLIAQYVGAIGNNYQQFAGATGVTALFYNIYINIPIVNNNKVISNVFYGKSKNGENQIKSTIKYKKYTGTKQFRITYSANPTVSSSFDEKSSYVTIKDYDPYYNKSETGEVSFWSEENEDGSYKPIKRELVIGKETTKIVSSSIDDITNINSVEIKKSQDGLDYFANIKMWIGGEYYSGSLPKDKVSQGSLSGNSYDFWATAEKIEPLKVEISIYGNTIGIDLTDKTVYINGEMQKKVHSIDGNELMQTSNYLLDSGKKAIETMYGETRKEYENGKETATIRCSIGDYFDYDSKEKVISIDNSTGKMSFKMYDQVIPMIYGADGKDRPMSTYQDGSPKVFKVLGSKIYYDGAVWQELSLQEA
jgi:hypothetical protein